MTATVAALYVQRGGVYWGRDDVDAWDKKRDAKLYTGKLPVVAHPPCQLWVAMAGVNFVRYKGAHNRPGNDGGTFARALEDVRRCGGVLEHPAKSYAWSTFALMPAKRGWTIDERTGDWVCEVAQSAYGHKSRKLTWLLYSGLFPPMELDWSRHEGTHRIGHDAKWRTDKPRLEGPASSATPPAFAEALLSLARNCGGPRQ